MCVGSQHIYQIAFLRHDNDIIPNCILTIYEYFRMII